MHGSLSKTAFSVQGGRGNDDYWSEEFDKNKNCEQEEKITKLINEVGVPSKKIFCASQVSRKSLTILQANDKMHGDGTGLGQCSSVPVFTHKNLSQSGQFL